MKDTIYAEDIPEILAGGCTNPQCVDPKCGSELSLSPMCHPNSGVDVWLRKGEDRVALSCHKCGKFIVLLQVANKNSGMEVQE